MVFTILKRFWPQIAITLIVFAFFAKLYFPPSLYTTPDFGRSDLINFNIPMRYIMSESLKHARLPLWEPKLGQGFPVLDEGQIGFFYPPNMFLYGFLPFWLAFNLGFLVTFVIAALGTYLLARSIKISKEGSTIAALTFAFCPMMVLQIHHYNLIQSLSWFPWILYLTNEFFQKQKFRYLLFLSITISIQILVGFQQITTYSLTAAILFFIFKQSTLKSKINSKLLGVIIFLSFIFLGFTLAFVQIAPTYTLTKEAKRTALLTPQKILSEFPYKFSNIPTIINPYLKGNPKEGTYPRFQSGRWGIFWENTTYFGLVQLVLAMAISTKTFFKPKKENGHLIFFLVGFALLGIMLSLGSSAPLHPLFSFPPFSLFRVPSRFLMFTFISAAILAGLSIDQIPLKKRPLLRQVLIIGLIALSTADIFRVWSNYHQIEPKDEVLKPSVFTKKINKEARIFSFGLDQAWTEIFTKSGWQNANYKYYDFFNNSLSPDANIISGISQQDVYAGMAFKRIDILTSILGASFTEKDGLLEISKIGEKILDANNVRYLTTLKPLKSQNWDLIDEANFKEYKLYLWENPKKPFRAYIASGYEVATTTGEFGEILGKDDTDITKTPVLEENINFPKSDDVAEGSINITISENTNVESEANLKKESLIVLSDSYYPGWKAYIDGDETRIYPANINSRTIIVPAGNHTIKFTYQPKNIQIGSLVSFLSIILTIAIYKFLKFKNLY